MVYAKVRLSEQELDGSWGVAEIEWSDTQKPDGQNKIWKCTKLVYSMLRFELMHSIYKKVIG